MLRKIISLILVAMLMATMFTGVVFAQDASVGVKHNYSLWVRHDGSAATVDNNYVTCWGDRSTYSLYDFTDVIPYIYASKSIKAFASYSYRVYGLVMTALDDSYEQYVNDSLTSTTASSYGMSTGGYTVVNGTDVEAATTKTFDADKDALISALETGDNGIIAVRFSTPSGSANTTSAGVTLTFNYDDEKYLDDIADYLDWSNVSDVDADKIIGSISFPSKLAGCDVTWSSDSPAINVETGVVHNTKEDQAVTLTATLSHGGKTTTKEFNVVVVGEEAKTVTIPFTKYGGSRSGYGLEVGMSRYICVGGSYTGVAQLDLSGYEEVIGNPGTTVSLNFNSEAGGGNSGLADFTVYLTPDRADAYQQSDSYTTLQSLGMFDNTRPVLAVDNDGEKVSPGANITVNANREILSQVLNESGLNSLVTLNIASTAIGIIRMTASNATITYFESEINDEDYVNELAQRISWSEISSESIDAVSQNLNLPASYAGAKVIWASSNQDAVLDDGTVNAGQAVKSTTLTASLSYKGYSATKEFNVTLAGEKAKEIKIPYTNYGSARAGQAFGIALSRFIYAGGDYAAVAQLDLTGYEEILKNPKTSLKLALQSEANINNGNLYDYTVYIAPDKADVYKVGDSFESVKALGAFDTTRPVLAVDDDGVGTSAAGTVVTVDANRENLVAALDEFGSQNSVVTLYITTTRTSVIDMRFTGLTINYYESEVDDAAYNEELQSEFTLENLTADDASALKNNLPVFFRGASVKWSADKDVITEDGKLKPVKEADVEAKLTATVSYKAYSFTKDFDVTVAKLLPSVKRVSMSSIAQIGASAPDNVYGVQFAAYYFLSAAHGDATSNGRGDTHVFMKFDLSGVLKELDAAASVTLNIGNRAPQGSNGMVTVMSNRYDNWDSSLTYNMATAKGMYSDPGYYIEYGVPFNTTKTVLNSADFQQAIKDAVAANPDEGLVTFRISSSDYNQHSFQLNGDAGTPYIEITYYEDELKTDAELVSAKKNSVEWSAVTSQDMDNVVADLTLPATWYGSAITWSSSDENVISKEGKVTIGDVAKEVTLTATVDGAANEFKLIVPANKIALKSEYTHVKSDYDADGNRNNKLGSNLNYTAVSIYANEDLEGAPDVFLAIYNEDGTVLESVSVVNDVTVKEGYNCFISDRHYEFGNKVTKAFIVDDTQALKPLAVAR